MLKQGKIGMTTGVHLTPTLNKEGKISSKIIVGPVYDEKSPMKIVRAYFPLLPRIYPYFASKYAKIKGEQDFIIKKESRAIHLLNIDSPGLTSSLAIAEHIGKMLS